MNMKTIAVLLSCVACVEVNASTVKNEGQNLSTPSAPSPFDRVMGLCTIIGDTPDHAIQNALLAVSTVQEGKLLFESLAAINKKITVLNSSNDELCKKFIAMKFGAAEMKALQSFMQTEYGVPPEKVAALPKMELDELRGLNCVCYLHSCDGWVVMLNPERKRQQLGVTGIRIWEGRWELDLEYRDDDLVDALFHEFNHIEQIERGKLGLLRNEEVLILLGGNRDGTALERLAKYKQPSPDKALIALTHAFNGSDQELACITGIGYNTGSEKMSISKKSEMKFNVNRGLSARLAHTLYPRETLGKYTKIDNKGRFTVHSTDAPGLVGLIGKFVPMVRSVFAKECDPKVDLVLVGKTGK